MLRAKWEVRHSELAGYHLWGLFDHWLTQKGQTRQFWLRRASSWVKLLGDALCSLRPGVPVGALLAPERPEEQLQHVSTLDGVTDVLLSATQPQFAVLSADTMSTALSDWLISEVQLGAWDYPVIVVWTSDSESHVRGRADQLKALYSAVVDAGLSPTEPRLDEGTTPLRPVLPAEDIAVVIVHGHLLILHRGDASAIHSLVEELSARHRLPLGLTMEVREEHDLLRTVQGGTVLD